MKTLAVLAAFVALAGCSRTQPNINFCLVDCQYAEDRRDDEPKPEPKYIVIEQAPVPRPVVRYYK